MELVKQNATHVECQLEDQGELDSNADDNVDITGMDVDTTPPMNDVSVVADRGDYFKDVADQSANNTEGKEQEL